MGPASWTTGTPEPPALTVIDPAWRCRPQHGRLMAPDPGDRPRLTDDPDPARHPT